VSIDKKKLFRTVLLGSAATALTGAAFGANSVAFAQDADNDKDKKNEEQVTVTGSRIPRADLVANSPVAVVGAEEIALTGNVKVGELLNDVPQVVPGLSTTNNNPSGAITTLDLRGLGPNRTLILVNGRRWMPANLAGISDAASIPAGMIERIDVVTGGASATYGSDAMAGVVNFILKDDFEGLSSTAQYSIQSKGDGQQIYVDGTMGANFADGRGNVMINVSWFKQNPILQGDRAFSSNACFTTSDGSGGPVPTSPFGPFGADAYCGALNFTDSATGTSFIAAGGSSRVPQGRVDGLFGPVFGERVSGTRSLVFNNNGTTAHRAFGPITATIPPGESTFFDLYSYSPPNYLQLPVTRTTFNLQGHYDINDDIEFFMNASYVNTDIATRLAPVPATTRVNLNTSNPFFQGITIGDSGKTLLDALVLSACLVQLADQCGTGVAGTSTTTTTSMTDGKTNTNVQTYFTPSAATNARNWLANNNNGNMSFITRRRMIEVGARENPN
jgi:outer membrane receptor protein involved in Fe transport